MKDMRVLSTKAVSLYDISQISVNIPAINSSPFLRHICGKALSAFSLAIFLELPSSCFYNSSPHPTQIGVRSNFTLKRVKNLFHILTTFCILFKFFDCLDPFKLSCKLSSCFTDLITTLIQAFELSLCLCNRHPLLCLYGCS